MLPLLALALPLGTSAQQYRNPDPGATPLRKSAIERRLASRHPVTPADKAAPIPGKYLLDRPAARKSELATRIRATQARAKSSRSQSNFAATTTNPGIQLRPSGPGGLAPVSVVTGDFNRDGHMDYITANAFGNDLWFYAGRGDGTFDLPRVIPITKGLNPVYVAAGDLRGNGILDLVVAEYDSFTVGVLLGNGDGTFGYETEYPVPEAPAAIVIDDFGHHGHLDIVVAQQTVNGYAPVTEMDVLPGDGTGSFGAIIPTYNGYLGTAPTSVSSADLNGDGYPDILLVGPAPDDGAIIYLNNGDSTFTRTATLVENGPFNTVLSGALGDLNRDGCPDAAAADVNNYVWVFLGDCHGNFSFTTQVPMGDSNSWIVLADMNGDGNLDLVTTTLPVIDPIYGGVAGNVMSVAYGDGKGNFRSGRTFVGTGESYSLALADFNEDHHLDVVSASPDSDTTTVYLNDGTGDFGFPQGEWVGVPKEGVINAPMEGLTFADLNHDGRTDIFLLDEGYNGDYVLTTLLNDGTGRFAPPLSTEFTNVNVPINWIGDYKLGDFRKTGILDFVSVGLSAGYSGSNETIIFAPGIGDGTFGSPTVTPVPGAQGAMAIGDFNRDGKLDFVAIGQATDSATHQLAVFLGAGNGTFNSAGITKFSNIAYSTNRVYAGDFNRDGKLDILAFESSNGYWTTSSSVWEFLGNGDGTFQLGVLLYSGFQPMTLADLNNDGFLDIARYDFQWPDGATETLGPPRFTTYLGQPSGAFAQSDSQAPYAGIAFQFPPFLQFGDPRALSMVADLNGDGNLDEIAWQYPSNGAFVRYAQILAGKGNGTFTPNYDIFPFPWSGPGYAMQLESSSSTDLVQLAGATSGLNVYKSGPAPALQLALEDEQVIGTSSCGWVFPNLISTSDRSVVLATSVPGVHVPAAVTIPGGALQARFCYTLDTSYDWHQVFDIRAQLEGDTAIAYASQSYVAAFASVLSPTAEQDIYSGTSTAPVTVTLTSVAGYSSTVHLSCIGLPSNATCAFDANDLRIAPGSPASANVVVHTSAGPNWYGPVVVVASDPNVTVRAAFQVAIVTLDMFPLDSTYPTVVGGSIQGNVTLLGIPPYNPTCSGLPAPLHCDFTGPQNPYPGDTILIFSVNLPSGFAAGNYPFTIAVSSGPQSVSNSSVLQVTDFSLSPPTTTAWAAPGIPTTVLAIGQPVNGFHNYVNVTCSINFAGTCDPGSAGINGPNSSIVLYVQPSATAAPGAYTTSITGTVNNDTHSLTFPFYVATMSGTLDNTALTMAAGGSGVVNLALTATAGFSGNVQLSCEPTAIVCSFNPASITVSGTAPNTVAVTMKANSWASNHPPSWRAAPTALALLVPVTLWFGWKRRRQSLLRAAAIPGVLALLLISLSCGGGGGTPGGGGQKSRPPATYAVHVKATLSNSSYIVDVGTVNVTVTH